MRVFYSRNCQLLCTLWVEKAVYFLGSGSGLVWGSEDWKAGVTGAGRAGDRLGGWPLAGARPEQLSQPANSVLQETEPASHLIHHHHLTLSHPGDSHPRHPRHIVKIVSTSREWEAGVIITSHPPEWHLVSESRRPEPEPGRLIWRPRALTCETAETAETDTITISSLRSQVGAVTSVAEKQETYFDKTTNI